MQSYCFILRYAIRRSPNSYHAGAIVAGPITIGDGAEIGANAVVLKDVPKNALMAGVPAKVIRIK